MNMENADPPSGRKSGWKQNPEAVRQDILHAAIAEFAEKGLSTARVDDIAAKTKTSKRMIYYYFDDKQTLYEHALEAAYAQVRQGENALQLDHLSPQDALAKLVAFTFDHHRNHPDFIRMVMIENVHHAETLAKSEAIQKLNIPVIEKLAAICTRGQADGIFRTDVDPTVLHWQISALSFFNVSNRPTFSALFGDQLFAEAGQAALREQVVHMVLASVYKSKDRP